MSQRKGFDPRKTENKEEKLVAELVKCLDETTVAFIGVNYSGGLLTKESILVLLDASIGYAGNVLRKLVSYAGEVKDKKDMITFLDEAKALFNCYIERIKQEQGVK